MNTNGKFITKSVNYKDMLSVEHFLFQERQFKIYGSNENPLFLVNDIVSSLLGFSNISNNQFFRDNRDNQEYITTREFPVCPSDLQERYKSNKPDRIYFFTEKGLYKCLMRSNKPIAEDFENTISNILSDMRQVRAIKELEDICQSESIELDKANTTIQSFQKYKEILSVSYFIFEGANIRIEGTNEDPLFHCLDVVKILGCEKANQNKFYKNNKNNLEFVKTVTNSEGDEELGVTNSHPTKPEKYFTETGLYECLFASDSLIAKEFRREIVELLKNIRLGVIGLQIINEEELKRELAEKDTLLGDLEQKVTNQQGEIESLENVVQKSTRDMTLYTGTDTETGNIYGGRSFRIKRRIGEHLSNSCNPELRRAASFGRARFDIIATVPVITPDDEKFLERQLIDSIPADKRMNVEIPEYDASRVTLDVNREYVEIADEESKSDLNDQIIERDTEISSEEDTLLDTKPKLLVNALAEIDRLKKYLDTHKGVYPEKRSDNNEEHELAILVARIRKEMKGELSTAVTKDRLDYLKRIIPNFKLEGIDIKFESSVAKLRDFHDEYKRIPEYGGSAPNEKTIYGIMQRIKQAYQEDDKQYLTPERLQYVQEELPFLELQSKILSEFTEKAQILKAFFDKHQRIPLKKNPEEKALHTLYYTIKDELQSHDKHHEEKRAIVQQIYPELCDN